jgi:hypothetical protein
MLAGGLTGLAPGDVRASGAGGDRIAAAEQAAGVSVDASLSDSEVGGALPFLVASPVGVRPVLRIPVRSAQEVGDGASSPAVVSVPVSPQAALSAEDRLLAGSRADRWAGTLDAFGRFWKDRLGVSVDARAARAGGPAAGWFVRLSAPHTVNQQALVAPFPVAYAATGTGRQLTVRADGRTIVLPPFRTLLVQVAAAGRR